MRFGFLKLKGSRIPAFKKAAVTTVVAGLFWSLFSGIIPGDDAIAEIPTPTPRSSVSVGDSQPQPSASPSPRAPTFPPRSPAIPIVTPSISASVTPDEGRKLLRSFAKAQESEAYALKHRQSLEMKELKAFQSARLKEWESKERAARHKFFAEHKSGPERRSYIQDYLNRRKIFLQLQSDEKSQRAHDNDVRRDALKQDQAQRRKEFQEFLSRSERPPARLWP